MFKEFLGTGLYNFILAGVVIWTLYGFLCIIDQFLNYLQRHYENKDVTFDGEHFLERTEVNDTTDMVILLDTKTDRVMRFFVVREEEENPHKFR